jgi:hypothetical protein
MRKLNPMSRTTRRVSRSAAAVSNCTAVSKVTAPVNATSIRAELRREYHPSRKMFWRVKFIV